MRIADRTQARLWALAIIWCASAGLYYAWLRTGMLAPMVFYHLVWGWLLYPLRVFPQIQSSWAGIANGIVCFGLFAAGPHSFLHWLYANIGTSNSKTDPLPAAWKPRWTASIVTLVIVMFSAGICAVGITHQIGWMFDRDHPLIKREFRKEVFSGK